MRIAPEITEYVDLCLPDGRLNRAAVGWSRRPLHRCNLRGQIGRKKRWDYWCVTTEAHVLAVTVADLDYLGIVNAYFMEYESGREIDRTAVVPFGVGIRQPEMVGGADIEFGGQGVRIAIREEAAGTRLLVEAGRGGPWNKGAGDRLSADVVVERPEGHETLGVVVPWSDDRFQYTSKHNTRPARGSVTAGGTRHAIGPSIQAFGCLDFGRGVWPADVAWNWASASGRQGGVVLGLQFGAKWTDGTGMNENALCVDGRLHKLHEDVVFTYDRARWADPWKIRTRESDSVDLTFTPFFERDNRVELGVARAETHQMFGRFEGTVWTGAGPRIAVSGMIGWAEEHRARW